MQITAWGKLISVLVIVAVLVFTVWLFGYHSFEFSGGQEIRDAGFFSYPRYHAELGDLPMWKSGEYLFTVHGLPPGPLDLVLQVVNAGNADREELTSLSTVLNVSIADASGKEICVSSGSLADAKGRGRYGWVLASSVSSASFWQAQCQQLPISRFKTYKIRVAISGVDERSPQKMLRPVLQGGGHELP